MLLHLLVLAPFAAAILMMAALNKTRGSKDKRPRLFNK